MSGENYTQVPTIILKGQWLKTAGFEAGDYVEAECDGDKITLTKTTPPEAKSTKRSLEEKKRVRFKAKKEISEDDKFAIGFYGKERVIFGV